MTEVTIYTTGFCSYCHRAKKLLDSKGVAYREISVDTVPGARQEMTQRSGGYTVPQIFIGETHVGGCDELYALERAGKLDSLLEPAQ